MTTDNKTLAIDVLQWLGDERFMYEPGTASRVKCEEAHAAVAELIQIAMEFSDYVAVDHNDTSLLDRGDMWDRLGSAVSRVKGESA